MQGYPYCALDPAAERVLWTETGGAHATAITHTLPDGLSFSVGAERWQACEVLFSPELLSLAAAAVQEFPLVSSWTVGRGTV